MRVGFFLYIADALLPALILPEVALFMSVPPRRPSHSGCGAPLGCGHLKHQDTWMGQAAGKRVERTFRLSLKASSWLVRVEGIQVATLKELAAK